MDEDDAWFEGLVFSETSQLQFLVIWEKGFSAIINRDFFEKKLSLGDFAKVKYVPKINPKLSETARHIVTDFVKISPLAETRVEKIEKRQTVLTRTTAIISEYTKMKNKKYFILKNELFGYFIDLKKLISSNAKMKEVEFEFKCVQSPLDEYSSIFVPQRVIRFIEKNDHEMAERFETLIGFVIYDAGDIYWAFSKRVANNIVLPKCYGNENKDLKGKWVRMKCAQKRGKLVVCAPVEIIDDVMKSRVIHGVAELFIDAIYEGKKDGEYHQFYSEELGNIVDVHGVVPNREMATKISGWVSRHKRTTTVSRWKFSPEQIIVVKKKSENEEEFNNRRSRAEHELSEKRGREEYERSEKNNDWNNYEDFQTTTNEDFESDSSAMFSDDDDEEEEEKAERNVGLSENIQIRKKNAAFSNLKNFEDESEEEEEEEEINDSRKMNNFKNVELASEAESSISFDRSTEQSSNLREFKRLKQIVRQFLMNQEVRKAMKTSNVEAFEELANIVYD